MIIGKLYQVKKLFWYLYPSKEIVLTAADEEPAAWLVGAAVATAYLSKKYNGNIAYICPNDMFCLLEEDGKYLKVLTTTGELGWMIYPENENWAKGTIEEVKQ